MWIKQKFACDSGDYYMTFKFVGSEYPSFLHWDIVLKRFSEFDLQWLQMTYDLRIFPTIRHPHTTISMKSIRASYLEILCLQGFQCLTLGDPRWPLSSTKNDRINLLTITHPHTTYQICVSFLPWDIVLTKFSVFDPWWPQMTFDLHQKI